MRAPAGWQLNCALALQPQADGSVRLEPASLARLIDSPLQMGRYAKRIELSRLGAAAAAGACDLDRGRQRGGAHGAR